MINLDRHSALKNSLILLLFFIAGCKGNEQKNDFVVKVNDSYLTEKDLTAISGGYGGQKFFKEEMIRDWVNTELLYQQALKEGLTETDEYRRIMKNSGKKLAASLMLEKIYEGMPQYKPEDVKHFFEENSASFHLTNTAYILNTAVFSDENKAVSFRSAAVESDWNKALNFYSNDQALNKRNDNQLIYAYDLQPVELSRIINELHAGEVSLVLLMNPDKYMVVKLISRLDAGTLPPFEVIKDDVESRFLAHKKAEFLKEYFEDLYSANDIEIKQ